MPVRATIRARNTSNSEPERSGVMPAGSPTRVCSSALRDAVFAIALSGRVGGADARARHRRVTGGSRAGQGNESGNVEDEADAAVAQDGGARDAVDLPEVRFQALDHHLLLAEETVDEEGGAAPLMLEIGRAHV